MSLVTLQRSPDATKISESIRNYENICGSASNAKKSYLENVFFNGSGGSCSNNNENFDTNHDKGKQIDFDKEFNFRDLKEIYDETSTAKTLLNRSASMLNKPVKAVKTNIKPITDYYMQIAREIKCKQLSESAACSLSSSNRQLFEKYFVVKDAALILPRRSRNSSFSSSRHRMSNTADSSITNSDDKHFDYFQCNESALSMPQLDCSSIDDKSLFRYQQRIEQKQQKLDASTCSSSMESLENTGDSALSATPLAATGDILVHLKAMVQLLRPLDTISVAVKLCSYHTSRIRYLVVVETPSSRSGNVSPSDMSEESALLGLDLQEDSQSSLPLCSVGLVLPIYANCEISLNGDGGFKFKTHQSTHIFKPVSIQAMWSAYQYLHKALENARKYNFYSISSVGFNADSIVQSEVASNHEWVKYYVAFIGKYKTDQQYLNEWYQKEERSAQREDFTTPYFDQSCLTKEQEVCLIHFKLFWINPF